MKPTYLKQLAQTARTLAISAVALAVLFWLAPIDLREPVDVLANADPRVLAGVFALYLAASVLRGIRLKQTLPGDVPLVRIVGLSMHHQFWAKMLPVKLGEFSLPALLKADGVSPADSLGKLLAIRVADLAVLLPLVIAFTLVSWPYLSPVFRSLLPVVFAISVAVVLVSWVLGRLNDTNVQSSRLTIAKVFRVAVEELSVALCGWSLVIWLCMSAAAGVLFGFIVELEGPPQLHIALALWSALLVQVPIHGWAGVGTTEAVLVFVLYSSGVEQSQALSASVVIHATQIGFTILLFPLGSCLLLMSPIRIPSSE